MRRWLVLSNDLYGAVMAYGGAPTASQNTNAAALDTGLTTRVKEFEELAGPRLSAVNGRLKSAGVALVDPPKR